MLTSSGPLESQLCPYLQRPHMFTSTVPQVFLLFPKHLRICLGTSEEKELKEVFSHFLQYADRRARDLLGLARSRPKCKGKNYSLNASVTVALQLVTFEN